jgi:tetratricopeptide (TPR) repeat protein
MFSKAHLTKKPLLVALGILVALCGYFLGDVAWRMTPAGWKLSADTRYLFHLGSAEDMRGRRDFHDAEATLKEAIQLCPNRYEAYYDLGNVLLSEGRTNAAMDNYKTALLYCGDGPTNLISHDEQLRQRAIISQRILILRGQSGMPQEQP